MSFSHIQPFPGIYHIQDAMGVCFTLLTGNTGAVLVDTGYGLEDVSAYVNSITQLPLRVILSHAHHDHILGSQWFSEIRLCPIDLDDFAEYTAESARRRVLSQAAAKGISVNEQAFLQASIPNPLPQWNEVLDLGGLTVEIRQCPGHTPGSLVFYVPKYQLLLTADDWNPCTWLFFRRALPVHAYLRSMRELLPSMDVQYVLCSHRFELFPVAVLKAFLDGVTDMTLSQAVPKPELAPAYDIDPRECSPAEGQIFVFDWNKYQK